jgi:hypothetical protein
MKRKSFLAFVILVVLSFSWNAFAHGAPYYFNAMPAEPQTDNGYIKVLPAKNAESLIFADHGKPFPAGTKTQRRGEVVTGRFLVEYQMPGDIWRPLTADMIYCVDTTGKPCPVPATAQPTPAQTPLTSLLVIQPEPPKQPDPPPEEEKFQCVGWGLIGGLPTAAAATAIPNRIESNTSNTSAEIYLGEDWMQALGGYVVGSISDCTIQYLMWKAEQDKKARHEAKQHKKNKHRD